MTSLLKDDCSPLTTHTRDPIVPVTTATELPLPVVVPDGGVWRSINTDDEVDRFIEIMHLMDRRYLGLCRESLDGWRARKQSCGLTPELVGWFSGLTGDLSDMLQVMAFTSHVVDGQRREPSFSMLGVAADAIPETDWTEENVRLWLARFVLQMADLVGLEAIVHGVRRKTMTWHPMQRLHEIIREGLYVQRGAEAHEVLYSSVVWERDLAAIAYCQMQTVRVPAG